MIRRSLNRWPAPRRRGFLDGATTALTPLALGSMLLLGSGLGLGCSDPTEPVIDDPEPPKPDCISSESYFTREVWIPTLSKTCLGCHAPGGVAEAADARLVLLPQQYPNFLDINFETVRTLVQDHADGAGNLLQKPLGAIPHVGGMQMADDDPRYQALTNMVDLLQGGIPECEVSATDNHLDDVVLLDALGTYRKASMQLAGRMPTPAEIDTILEDGDSALPGLVDALLEEDAFYDRLKEMMNDILLVRKYLEFPSSSITRLGVKDYPFTYFACPDPECYWTQAKADRAKIGAAIANEALDLIGYIVKNDRPFSEILTAPYTVVNPYSAKVYRTGTQFDDATDEREFHEATVQVYRTCYTGTQEPCYPDNLMQMPHSGILTTPMFLNRHMTTPTNRNRGRIRLLLDTFLATDIMEFSDRPIDPLQAGAYENPVMEDPGCVVCHRVIDPMAGAFMRWQEFDQQGEYYPDQRWYTDVFAPGYGDEVMPVEEYPNATRWMAERIVADPRFPTAISRLMFKAITGQTALRFPGDAEAGDFEQSLVAWETQNGVIRELTQSFEANGMQLKPLIREVVLSPYFRAQNTASEPSEQRAAELGNVGTARLIIPEVLGRKIEAVTGLPWPGYGGGSKISNEYNLLYGGIDSIQVTERLTSPNAVMTGLIWRMANDMSCELVSREFLLDPERRRLVPHVALDTIPVDASGDPIPEAEALIKQNIQHMHAHVLGEALTTPDHPEVLRTYQLFLETLLAGRQAIADGSESPTLHWRCQATRDPDTGDTLPWDQRVSEDPDYTVRAWMAVTAYLLSDYRFIFE